MRTVAELVAERKAEPSPSEDHGRRPLHCAALQGHVALAEHLALRRREAALLYSCLVKSRKSLRLDRHAPGHLWDISTSQYVLYMHASIFNRY